MLDFTTMEQQLDSNVNACDGAPIKPEYSIFRSQVIGNLVGYWNFTSWQHLRSYQDGYSPVTMCTHDDFIEQWPDIPLSHMIMTLS